MTSPYKYKKSIDIMSFRFFFLTLAAVLRLLKYLKLQHTVYVFIRL
jgi:hypothetical protein